MVELIAVERVYPGPPAVHALHATSLRIAKGEYVAITGPSGSGKSTLLNLLGLLDEPSSGRLVLDGIDVSSLSPGDRARLRARSVGFVFQSFHLLQLRSAAENVELGLLYSGTRRRERPDRATAALRSVGLQHRVHAFPSTLSGGEAQRVAIARAVAGDPPLLLCDEPTGNLDGATTAVILDLLDELNRRGHTIVVVTHDERVAGRAHRRIVIEDGMARCEPPAAHDHPALASRTLSSDGRTKVGDIVREAVVSVLARPGRSLLTAFGTVIGVASLIAILGLTATAAAGINARFDALAATSVEASVFSRPGEPGPLLPPDAEHRLKSLDGVVSAGILWTVAPPPSVVRVPALGAETYDNIPVVAASPGALEVAGIRRLRGSAFRPLDNERRARVALLGRAVASRLGIVEPRGGEVVFLSGVPFGLLGVIEDVERRPDLLLSVVVPADTAAEVFGAPSEQVAVVETRPRAADVVARQMGVALRPDRPDSLSVATPPDPRSLQEAVSSDVQALMLGLAAVALVVGSFGIANATLVSVLERVREIGLRRALGAHRRHVAGQFLLEGAVVGTIGGILGACAGVLAIAAVALSRSWSAVIDPRIVLGAPLVGTLTGTVAAAYPALKAAKFNPVVALRHE